jgi:chemotaxis protein histidine kinase CheA
MAEATGLTAEMYQAIVTIVDERVKEIRVTREDFNALQGAVQELAQAQARTGQWVHELAQAQARTEQRMAELAQAQARTEQRVQELAQAQARTEQRMEELAQAQARTEQRVQELAQAQARTEQRVEELAQAQARTEQRVEELAQAQARTEERVGGLERAMQELALAQARTEERVGGLERAMQELALAQARTEERVGGLERAMQELAQAQARTEEQITRLVEAQENLARQVGGLSDTIGFGLEDIAKVVLPGYLQRHFGIMLEGKLGEELGRHFFHIDGFDVEINLYGEGKRNGQRVVVLGEAKSRIYRSDVEKFAERLAVIGHVLKGEVVRVMFGYFLHPSAELAARERDILLVASYQR